MSLDVSKLNKYTDENKMPLIKRTMLEGRTTSLITVQPEIKSTATINILDSELELQAGACGFNDAGTTNLTQRDLSVCPLKVNESICLDTLESHYTQTMMQAGSYNEDIPFEEIYSNDKADKIANAIEQNVWKGNADGYTGHTACDGFIHLFEETAASGQTIDGNVDNVTAITKSNVIDVIDGMAENIHEEILDSEDLVLFVGYEVYRLWASALRDANLFHYDGAENQGDSFSQVIPGTNIRVYAVKGLNGTKRMYASRASNFYFGTDMLNDYENFEIFYSKDNQEVRFVAKFKFGVNVAFPEFVTAFKLA